MASLAGALAAGLAAMVANLTAGKKGYEAHRELMLRVGVDGQRLKDEFLYDIDRDTDAFNEVMAAMKLPKKTDEEKAARADAMETANKGATLVPLGVLQRCVPALELAREMARHGNRNSISDAGVGGLMGRAAAEGAYYNVLINLKGIDDKAFVEQTRAAADRGAVGAHAVADEIAALVRDELSKSSEESRGGSGLQDNRTLIAEREMPPGCDPTRHADCPGAIPADLPSPAAGAGAATPLGPWLDPALPAPEPDPGSPVSACFLPACAVVSLPGPSAGPGPCSAYPACSGSLPNCSPPVRDGCFRVSVAEALGYCARPRRICWGQDEIARRAA